MSAKYIIGIVIIVGFLIFAGINFQKSLTPYVSLAEAKERSSMVQIKGARVDGSDYYDSENETFNFKIVDPEGAECLVIYDGIKPSNFEEAKEIVAKGKFENGTFMASELLVKCPSKYEAEGVKGAQT